MAGLRRTSNGVSWQARSPSSRPTVRVRNRKREDLTAEIEEGALSCNLVHLANISYRVGRTLQWDAKDAETRLIRGRL